MSETYTGDTEDYCVGHEDSPPPSEPPPPITTPATAAAAEVLMHLAESDSDAPLEETLPLELGMTVLKQLDPKVAEMN